MGAVQTVAGRPGWLKPELPSAFTAARPGLAVRWWDLVDAERDSLALWLPVAFAAGVAAWFIHADAGYSFASGRRPRLSAEFDAISGDRPGGRFSRFDTLFGMRHADFSPGSIFAAIGRANMVAQGLRFEVQPNKASDGFVSARAM